MDAVAACLDLQSAELELVDSTVDSSTIHLRPAASSTCNHQDVLPAHAELAQ